MDKIIPTDKTKTSAYMYPEIETARMWHWNTTIPVVVGALRII